MKFSTLNEQDVEDIMQESRLKAWGSRETFDRAKGSFLGWFRTIAKRTAISKVQSNPTRAVSLADPNQVEDDQPAKAPIVTEEQHALREIIASLPERDRDIVLAFMANPRGYASVVAAKHEMKVGYVRKRKKELFDKTIPEKMAERGFEFSPASEGPDSLKELLTKLALVLKPGRINTLSEGEWLEILSGNELPADEDQQEPMEPRALKAEPPRFISSGFSAFDALLGGKGFVQGSTILIRGQPGTGKTTLALQVAKRMMDVGHSFVFASIEDEPEILLDQITQSFWDKTHAEFLGESGQWYPKDLTDYFDRDVAQEAKNKTIDELCVDAGLTKEQRESLVRNPTAVERLIDHLHLQAATRSAVRATLREMDVGRLLGKLWDDLPMDESRPVILVVDSLNALINCAAMRFQEVPERQMILAVLNSFRNWRRSRRGDVTVMFLVEEDARIVNAAASYLADTVIDLRSENVEQTIYETSEQPRKWVQEMRFCKVQKGRGLPIQSRSCGYEFVKAPDGIDCGIVFLPTYAASGVMSLFHENAPMLEVIRTLRQNDVPTLFPQVLVQEFSRTALQRVFSLSRRRTRISLRHPMMLSNVDEYWLQRLRQHDLLQPIPESKLTVFSLPLDPSTENADCTRFIKELTRDKEHMFAGRNKHDEKLYYGVPQIANVGMLIYRKDVLREIGAPPPTTWEDVEKTCATLKKNKPDLPNKLFLELTSYDTFLASALELGWGNGAFWRTVRKNGRLRIVFDKGSGVAFLIAALVRLKHWIHTLEILPKRCSVDPEVNPNQDWVFARHWYSTWIDVCTHQRSRELVENHEYGILPIPIAAAYRKRKKKNARHHSAWGEWYLAILRGTENIDLGIDLINNLMTARKVSERALSGAAIPTLERFYEITDEQCPGTDITFKQLRHQFFADAKSRCDFDDYPRFARIFSAVLRTVATNANADVVEAVRIGFRNIDESFQWPKNIEQQLLKMLPPAHYCSLRPQ